MKINPFGKLPIRKTNHRSIRFYRATITLSMERSQLNRHNSKETTFLYCAKENTSLEMTSKRSNSTVGISSTEDSAKWASK